MCSKIIIVLLLIFIFYKNYSYFVGDKTTFVQGYKVLDIDGQDRAAELLQRIDNDILQITRRLSEKYSKSGTGMHGQIARRALMYSSDSLRENYPAVPKKDVSYNLNKGDTIAICLRNYESPDAFHDYNEILFVSLHELAHSLNCNEKAFMCGNTYGHDDAFWRIFKILLQTAEELGLYQKKNYRREPVNYCSMNITYSPLFDSSI